MSLFNTIPPLEMHRHTLILSPQTNAPLTWMTTPPSPSYPKHHHILLLTPRILTTPPLTNVATLLIPPTKPTISSSRFQSTLTHPQSSPPYSTPLMTTPYSTPLMTTPHPNLRSQHTFSTNLPVTLSSSTKKLCISNSSIQHPPTSTIS